jgi:hypothetical protein
MSDHRKRPRDPSQLAKMIVEIASAETEDRPPTPEEQGKDPAAVERGRKGGLKGGKARAAKMTAAEPSQSAKKAVYGVPGAAKKYGRERVSTCLRVAP